MEKAAGTKLLTLTLLLLDFQRFCILSIEVLSKGNFPKAAVNTSPRCFLSSSRAASMCEEMLCDHVVQRSHLAKGDVCLHALPGSLQLVDLNTGGLLISHSSQ